MAEAQKYAGQTVTITASIPYSGVGGNFTFEFSLASGAAGTIASGAKDFTLAASASGTVQVAASGTIKADTPTGTYTLYIAIWDKPKGANYRYYASSPQILMVYGGTQFGNVSIGIS